MKGQAFVVRGDARALPLPDESVDLIVTSPPYFGLRSYTDGGEHYEAQIGSEPTPSGYVEALLDCTREWMRVLKPAGSLWVNLGDKYSSYGGTRKGHGRNLEGHSRADQRGGSQALGYRDPARWGTPAKSLLGLPWRYALACVDQLELILRAEVVWSKPNGLPESVTDRVRRSHEQWFHLTRQPRYYAAIDEIREPHTRSWSPGRNGGNTAFDARGNGHTNSGLKDAGPHVAGALPGSVWDIATHPLRVPDHLEGLTHYAAFPIERPRRLILGWSPPAICLECGEGRKPVTTSAKATSTPGNVPTRRIPGEGRHPLVRHGEPGSTLRLARSTSLLGYACACTPHTDHPGNGTTRRRDYSPGVRENNAQGTYGRHQAGEYVRVGPWREYHVDGWTPPPAKPAIVLDPFGGTGTSALAAKALGRIGITVDRSGDYCRLAKWRTGDRGELAKAMRVDRPSPELDGQVGLFELLEEQARG